MVQLNLEHKELEKNTDPTLIIETTEARYQAIH
jgi:hypothetical protein